MDKCVTLLYLECMDAKHRRDSIIQSTLREFRGREFFPRFSEAADGNPVI